MSFAGCLLESPENFLSCNDFERFSVYEYKQRST